MLTSLCLELPLPFSILLRLDRFHVLQYLQGPREQGEMAAEGSWQVSSQMAAVGAKAVR